MDAVYILHHVHEINSNSEDVKIIGVYSTPEEAKIAQSRVENLPGFKDTRDGFSIDRYQINETFWLEGFVSIL